MNQRPDLGALRESLDLRPTHVAEHAWEHARRRVRRRRVARAVGAAALVVVAVTSPRLLDAVAPDELAPASPPPTLPSPTQTVLATRTLSPGLAAERLDLDSLAKAADEATLVSTLDQVPLAESPVAAGVYALATDGGVGVMAPDGRYRFVAAPEPVLAFSLDPTATRLVIVGRDDLSVVDLTEGSSRTVPLPPGRTREATDVELIWVDDDHLVLTNPTRNAFVDLPAGTAVPTTLDATSTFGPGGAEDPVTWEGPQTIVTTERRLETSVSSVPDGPHLAGDSFAVSLGVASPSAVGVPRSAPGVGSAAAALVVLDRASGDPLATLPLTTGGAEPRLLALEGDVVVLEVGVRGAPLVLRWDWRSGDLRGTALLGVPDPPDGRPDVDAPPAISWGRGWDALATES